MKLMQLSTDPRNSTATPIVAGNREPCKAGHVYRVGRCLGYWLSGILLGAVGYVVGAFLPDPPADVICLSIAYGCFGLMVSVLLNVRVEPIPAPPRRCSKALEKPSTEAYHPAPAVSEVHLWSVGRIAGEPVLDTQILVLRSFPCVIGRRSECDHQLNCPFVSRRHCVLSLRDGRAWVHDLNSHHGTHLNGAAIKDVAQLADGDQLEIGPVPFRVCLVRKPDDRGEH